MEDIFRVLNRIWDDPSPLDYEGNYWKLSGATIGDQRRHRPKIWGMGEGPRLFDIATSHADGLGSVIPLKFQTPEHCQQRIDLARKAAAQKGRDPEKFELGMDLFLLCHPDENVVERALDSAPVKWMTALMGRIGADNWRKEGLEPPVPDDWMYFANYITTQTSDAFVEQTLAKISRKHVEASWIYGTPDQVEQQHQGPGVGAGVMRYGYNPSMDRWGNSAGHSVCWNDVPNTDAVGVSVCVLRVRRLRWRQPHSA